MVKNHKVGLEKIADDKKRNSSFCKRSKILIKKAMELS